MNPPQRSGGAPPIYSASSITNRLDKAYRAYQKRISRCQTENQRNRLHIAIDNYITPEEVRHFDAALQHQDEQSPSRQWITKLTLWMPVKKHREVEFGRRGLCKGATYYTANGVPAEKTLIIGFTSHFHRLMLPIPWLLDCLDPALYDVLVLRDFARRYYTLGIPGLGADFLSTLSSLRTRASVNAYRNTIALGTSGGGLPALAAAVGLGLHRGISVAGQDLPTVAARLRERGVDAVPYGAVLESRPIPFPQLILACGAHHPADVRAAAVLEATVPSETRKVRNCAEHDVLWWQLTRGALPAYLAQLFDQSLERARSSPPIAAARAEPLPLSAGVAGHQSRVCFDSGPAVHMTINPGRKT